MNRLIRDHILIRPDHIVFIKLYDVKTCGPGTPSHFSSMGPSEFLSPLQIIYHLLSSCVCEVRKPPPLRLLPCSRVCRRSTKVVNSWIYICLTELVFVHRLHSPHCLITLRSCTVRLRADADESDHRGGARLESQVRENPANILRDAGLTPPVSLLL